MTVVSDPTNNIHYYTANNINLGSLLSYWQVICEDWTPPENPKWPVHPHWATCVFVPRGPIVPQTSRFPSNCTIVNTLNTVDAVSTVNTLVLVEEKNCTSPPSLLRLPCPSSHRSNILFSVSTVCSFQVFKLNSFSGKSLLRSWLGGKKRSKQLFCHHDQFILQGLISCCSECVAKLPKCVLACCLFLQRFWLIDCCLHTW